MREHDRFTHSGRLFLSLILLIANVAAPFRTAAGRSFLDFMDQHHAPASLCRVWAGSDAPSSHCFRAVVGLNRGEPAEAPLSLTHVLAAIPKSSPVPWADLAVESAFPLLRPPLRC